MDTRAKLISIAAVAALAGFGKNALGQASTSTRDVVIGETITLFSEILDEEREILVGKPDGYDATAEAYPVLFVLDGDDHFHHTTGVTKFLASNSAIPDMLVVSIDNTIRPRDLTPPSEDPADRENFPIQGGADAFQAFIADELMPSVEAHYRTRPYHVLIGHSHGGLFATYSLMTRPELFDAYIAISPSLQWDAQRYVNRADAFFAATDELNVTFYMTAGNEGGAMLGGIRKLAATLDANAPRRFEWHFEPMPLESHGSVPMRSTYAGLEFIFAGWELLEGGRVDEAMPVVRRYRELIDPPAGYVVGLGTQYAERGQTDDAVELYRFALEIDPQNAAARSALTELERRKAGRLRPAETASRAFFSRRSSSLRSFLDPASRVSPALSREKHTWRLPGSWAPANLVPADAVTRSIDEYSLGGRYVLPRSQWYFGGNYTDAIDFGGRSLSRDRGEALPPRDETAAVRFVGRL